MESLSAYIRSSSGKRRAHFQKLKSAQFIGLRPSRSAHVRPALQYGVTRVGIKQPILEQVVDLFARQDRKTC